MRIERGALAVRLPCRRNASALQAQSGKGKAPPPLVGAFPCAFGGGFGVRLRLPCMGCGGQAHPQSAQ